MSTTALIIGAGIAIAIIAILVRLGKMNKGAWIMVAAAGLILLGFQTCSKNDGNNNNSAAEQNQAEAPAQVAPPARGVESEVKGMKMFTFTRTRCFSRKVGDFRWLVYGKGNFSMITEDGTEYKVVEGRMLNPPAGDLRLQTFTFCVSEPGDVDSLEIHGTWHEKPAL